MDKYGLSNQNRGEAGGGHGFGRLIFGVTGTVSPLTWSLPQADGISLSWGALTRYPRGVSHRYIVLWGLALAARQARRKSTEYWARGRCQHMGSFHHLVSCRQRIRDSLVGNRKAMANQYTS